MVDLPFTKLLKEHSSLGLNLFCNKRGVKIICNPLGYFKGKLHETIKTNGTYKCLINGSGYMCLSG